LSFGRLGQLALVVAILYWGRPVLVPVALALYFAFVLTPPSNRLEQLGLPRGLSVAAVLTASLGVLAVLGAVLVAQVADLASKIHAYSAQMSNKVGSLRGGGFKLFTDSSRALTELARSVEQQLGTGDHLSAVRVVPGGASPMQRLEEAFGPVLEPLAGIALVLVLTVFVLAHREDLRGRLILLLGTQNVTVTTRTMTEAFTRVSHLLLTQAYINSAFGGVIAVGLYFIGVPYALLWGAIAGILRFVPLLGPLVATLLPTLLAFVSFPGWQQALLTIALFLVVDLLLANFVEPLVLGKRTGVSALALLISAVFWTWLWGGLGLVLATPITVCAAVVGRHVQELRFLAVALGDEPGLNPDLNFYQRTLARASKDAYRLLRRKVSESSLVAAVDHLLIPALRLMVADQRLHAINQDAADRLVSDLDGLVTRLQTSAERPLKSRNIVGVAAESQADELLLRLLGGALAERGVGLHAVPPSARDSALAATLAQGPALVCIAALPPASNTNARFLCRRLRAELPGAYIVVLAPETEHHRSREAEARLREAGANQVVSTMSDATRLLLQESERAAAAA
jgi:predicted PurR-regulated permease PerM